MLTLLASLVLLTPQGKASGPGTNVVPPDPPTTGYLAARWAPGPTTVNASLTGPSSVNIPSGSAKSLLFKLDLSISDSDTFVENRPGGTVYPVYGTARWVSNVPLPGNGTAIPGGGTGEQALEFVNATTEVNSDSMVEVNLNYHALALADTPYPIERVVSFRCYDSVPATPTHNIHDTDEPVVSQNITITRA